MSCCPHYSLRLDSHKFKPRRDQRQAVNRFNQYIIGETYRWKAASLYPKSREYVRRRRSVFDLPDRIHESESRQLPTPPEPAHQFTVTLELDTFTEEKYDVFENYQRLVHRESPGMITRNGFRTFLCDSPLRREIWIGEDGKERQLGSYHQCYRLDGKLVAVGVLDLLPDCVSAVYFLYHESIHHFSPGKLGAIREIGLALEGGYRWWYPGYYVHSCAKMKYKLDYFPQYVLDPETLTWDLVDKEVLAVFDRRHYVSLSSERQGQGTIQQTGDAIMTQPEGGVDGAGCDEEDQNATGSFLLESGMPGIASLEQMREVNMDRVLLRSDFADAFLVTSDLVMWNRQDLAEFGGLKSRIAELVAAIGPDLMDELCLDFRKRR